MSKEQKRDKSGRFTKKVEVEVNVEEPKFKNQKEELEYWKTVAEGYKIALEDISSKYLNKCADYKRLERRRDYVMDALRIAYIQLGWFTNKLSWWTKRKYREKILDMQMDLDRMVAHAEGLDRE